MTTRDAAFLALLLTWSAAAQLSPEERRGSQIYLRGTSPSGREIAATLDNGRTRVPAGVVPCVNCHGPDGRGKPEGGVLPPDITWEALTKPYGVAKPDGRSHPPYTDSALKRAIAMGIDSGGHALDPVMPRFQLSYEDALSLLAFLKKLGRIQDPGISDTSLRIGVILPPDDRAIQTALSAYFDQLNGAGGIFNRRIEPVFWSLPVAGQTGAFRQWLNGESVFAFTGSFLPRGEIGSVLNETATPLISAFADEPDLSLPLNPYVFYLDSGRREEAGQLVRMAGKLIKPGGTAVVHAPGEAALGEYARDRLSAAGWKVLGADCQPASAIFWLASPAGLAACAAAISPDTRLFIPSSFAAQPATAVASAKLLTLALRKAGRALTRQKLVEELEGIYDVPIGDGLTVSYGPNRRTGGVGRLPYVLDLRTGKLVPVNVPSQ